MSSAPRSVFVPHAVHRTALLAGVEIRSLWCREHYPIVASVPARRRRAHYLPADRLVPSRLLCLGFLPTMPLLRRGLFLAHGS